MHENKEKSLFFPFFYINSLFHLLFLKNFYISKTKLSSHVLQCTPPFTGTVSNPKTINIELDNAN